MTMRTCLANLTLALWCSAPAGAAPAADNLASMVRAYRESPTPVRRKAIDTYAVGHPKEAALANFALGIALYEQRNYGAAIAELRPFPLAFRSLPITPATIWPPRAWNRMTSTPSLPI